MNKQQVKGATNRVTGEIKKQVGHLTGDSSTVVRGEAQQVKGRLQQGLGDAKEAVRQDDKRELSDTERERALKRDR
jgi:uncharacterized protein YjbJ (UPF0337 family)